MKIPTHLRCYARQKEGVWQAVCIDLNLAAQGKTLEKAKRRLHVQILDYVREACTIDRAHFEHLMNRKAPLSLRFNYYFAYISQRICHAKDGIYRLFDEPLPPFAHA